MWSPARHRTVDRTQPKPPSHPRHRDTEGSGSRGCRVIVGERGFSVTVEELVALHGRALLRTALMLTGDLADAEDLFQATLVHLLQRDVTAVRSLPAYAHRTLVNTFLSGRRRAYRREIPTPELPETPAADRPPGPGVVPVRRNGGCWRGCRGSSGRSWCSGTTRTAPTPRSRRCSAAARRRSARTPRAAWRRCGSAWGRAPR